MNMKLQELLRKRNFDKMYEYIVKFDPYSEGNRFAYLAAYDLLCIMEAKEGREYKIYSNSHALMHDNSKEITPVLCSDLEGSNWKKALGAEMVLCSEVENVPLDIIAAVCLWHITYYGFTPEDQKTMFTAEQEEKRYHEIKEKEKAEEKLLRSLVSDIQTAKPERKGFLRRIIDRFFGIKDSNSVVLSNPMIGHQCLGKSNHKLLNTEVKDRIEEEIEKLAKMLEEIGDRYA